MSESELQAGRIEMALKIISNEQDRHISLFAAIMQRIVPKDENEPDDETDLITWRLGEFLEELLSSTKTLDCARTILTGGKQ
jgi:hypothetical protein